MHTCAANQKRYAVNNAHQHTSHSQTSSSSGFIKIVLSNGNAAARNSLSKTSLLLLTPLLAQYEARFVLVNSVGAGAGAALRIVVVYSVAQCPSA